MATSVLAAITYAQQLCQTDSEGISSTLGLALYNDTVLAWTRDMLNKNMDAAGTQEAYRDLTTDSPNTYTWPDDMFSLKTIEVNFQDQEEQNYLQARHIDVANIQGRSFSWLRANQPVTSPLFDNRGSTFEIFPTPQTANARGIRIFYFLKPTEATDVGQAIPYPLSLDYRTASYLMAALYYTQQEDLGTANAFELKYEKSMNKIINIVSPGTQQPTAPQPLGITGWQY